MVTTNTIVAYNFDEGTAPFKNLASANRPAVSSIPNTWPSWTINTPSGKTGDYALQFANSQEVDAPNPNNAVLLDSTNPDFTIQSWLNFKGNPTNRMVLYYNNGPGGALSVSIDTNRTVFVTTLGIKDQTSNAKIPDDGSFIFEMKRPLGGYEADALPDKADDLHRFS